MDVFDSTISKATIGDLSYSPTAHISKTVEPHEKGESLEAVSISDDRIKGSEANHLPTPPIEIDEKNARPTSQETRVLLEQVSIETLRTYHIEYHLETGADYIVIPRHVPDFEMTFLIMHTQELRKSAVDQAQKVDSLPSGDQLENAVSPFQKLPAESVDRPSGHLEHQANPPSPSDLLPTDLVSIPRKTAPSLSLSLPAAIFTDNVEALLLSTNYVPFEKWGQPWEDTNRGKSVLDVAVRQEATPDTEAKMDTGIPIDILDSLNHQEFSTVPVRLSINSKHLRFQLSKITQHDLSHYVMQAPWKLLVHYHDQIKQRAQELKMLAGEESGDNGSKDKQQEAPLPSEDESINIEKEIGPGTGIHPQEIRHSTEPWVACEVCGQLLSDGHAKKTACVKTASQHFQCLIDFIDNDLKHVFELRQGLAHGTVRDISFDDLWHLFNPGDIIVNSGLKRERCAFRVFYTSGGRPLKQDEDRFEKSPLPSGFTLHCYYIDFDKRWLGPVYTGFEIPQFKGKQSIKSLKSLTSLHGSSTITMTIFPIRYLDDHETALLDLVKRGKRCRQLVPFSHKRYCGPSSVEAPEYLNSEIIIDCNTVPNNDGFGKLGIIAVASNEADLCTSSCVGGLYGCSTNLFNDNVVDHDRATQYTADLPLIAVRDANDNNLSDDHLMLLGPDIDAFVLRERCVFGVYIDLIQDLDGDDAKSQDSLKKKSGFQDLVLPKGHGDLVEALVRAHRSTAKTVDGKEKEKVQVDLIDGKGDGLIILLHGVPGVGKTSTAECVAAYTGRPLYPITCANIGLDPAEVETNLTGPEGHFRRAQQWNCVVLLDEADVFLAKRETRDNDAKRNALVSVFLRTLEYYPGILILTTNRVGSFDEAVISRIQLFLYYPHLDHDQTMQVWQVHINRVKASGLIRIEREDEEMIKKFAEEEWAEKRKWNGRQIRNFFQTAILLASYDAKKWHQEDIENGQAHKDSEMAKPRLTLLTLEKVAATTGKFIDYIRTTIPDGSHEKQQLDEGNRNDSWDETPKRRR
ncbi:hypothetical protein EG329_013912 [Mollisiaceae sp. DMI_Dod_QoI]|nr:hypothetical protein EG329_013912 [Helotiales sp. DMI_Dod_QoI]